MKKYQHQTQKTGLCSTTCISIIMENEGDKHTPEKLGKLLGVKTKGKTGIKLKKLASQKEKIRKLGYKIEIKYLHEIKNIPLFLKKNLSKKVHVIANIWMEKIAKRKSGHYVIITKYKNKTKKIKIMDTYPNTKKEYYLNTKKVREAMNEKGNGLERGFILLQKL